LFSFAHNSKSLSSLHLLPPSFRPLYLFFCLFTFSPLFVVVSYTPITAAVSFQSISSWIHKSYFLQLLHMYSYDYCKILYL
jgi:hypothetical protein